MKTLKDIAIGDAPPNPRYGMNWLSSKQWSVATEYLGNENTLYPPSLIDFWNASVEVKRVFFLFVHEATK